MTKKTTSPEFISLEEAAKMKEGTRITFVPGIQAIYAEALKNICYVKKIKITRVLHPFMGCLLYTSPSPRDMRRSRMPSSA